MTKMNEYDVHDHSTVTCLVLKVNKSDNSYHEQTALEGFLRKKRNLP